MIEAETAPGPAGEFAGKAPGVAKSLNLDLLAATYLQRQSLGGCHDPLARHDGR